MERWIVLLASGVLLLALLPTVYYVSYNRELTVEYSVAITAPANLSWTLWLPMTAAPMEVRAQEAGVSVQIVNTSRGSYINTTGSGNASLSGSSHTFVFDSRPLIEQGGGAALSGWDGVGGHWVYRATTDASATILISGGTYFWGASWEEDLSCGGPNFHGEPSEGWGVLPQGGTDCNRVIDDTPLLAEISLGVAGIACLVLGAVSRHRRRQQGEQVFLPPPS